MSAEHWPGDAGDLLRADPRGHVAAFWGQVISLSVQQLAEALGCVDFLGAVGFDPEEWAREVLDGC